MLFQGLVAFALFLLAEGSAVQCRGGCLSTISSRTRERYGRLARGNPTAGWVNLPNSVFHNFHDYLELYVSTVIPAYRVRPRTIEWGCLSEVIDFLGNIHPIKSCVAVVFVYRCKPCQSMGQTEMVGKMLAEGWEPVRCAGYFDLDKNVASHDHRFSMFYQEFASTPGAATTLSLSIDQETEFMFWGQIYRDSPMCAHQADEAACTAHSDYDCYWDATAQACKPSMCPGNGKGGMGPGYPMCRTCVHDEDNLLSP